MLNFFQGTVKNLSNQQQIAILNQALVNSGKADILVTQASYLGVGAQDVIAKFDCVYTLRSSSTTSHRTTFSLTAQPNGRLIAS